MTTDGAQGGAAALPALFNPLRQLLSSPTAKTGIEASGGAAQNNTELPTKPAKNLAPVDQVIAYITKGIKDQSLVPGQRLIEQEIVSGYNISRTPVRQALRILSGEGLVDLLPNRGARLKRMTRQDIIDMLVVLSKLSVFSIDKAIEKMDAAGAETRNIKSDGIQLHSSSL